MKRSEIHKSTNALNQHRRREVETSSMVFNLLPLLQHKTKLYFGKIQPHLFSSCPHPIPDDELLVNPKSKKDKGKKASSLTGTYFENVQKFSCVFFLITLCTTHPEEKIN